jgi:hypothetical protein
VRHPRDPCVRNLVMICWWFLDRVMKKLRYHFHSASPSNRFSSSVRVRVSIPSSTPAAIPPPAGAVSPPPPSSPSSRRIQRSPTLGDRRDFQSSNCLEAKFLFTSTSRRNEQYTTARAPDSSSASAKLVPLSPQPLLLPST